jgi:hypothetical protein
MPERLITHLRHLDLAVPDFGKQLDFFTSAWGLKSEHTDSGLAFLAAEGSPEQYVVRLRQADDKRVDLIAFGAASAADVDTLAGRLAADGVRLVSEPGTVQTPGGGYGHLRQRRLLHGAVGAARPERPAAAAAGRRGGTDGGGHRDGTQPRGGRPHAWAGARSTLPFGAPGTEARDLAAALLTAAPVTSLTEGVGNGV